MMLFESTFVALLASLAAANSSSIWSTTDRVITTSQWSTTDRVITTSQWSTTDRIITTSQWSTTDRVITTSTTVKTIPVPTQNYTTLCFTTPGAISTTSVPPHGNLTTYTTHPNATKTPTKPILPTNAITSDAVFTTSNALLNQGTSLGANIATSKTSDVPLSLQSSAAHCGDLNVHGASMVALGLSLICGIGASALSLS